MKGHKQHRSTSPLCTSDGTARLLPEQLALRERLDMLIEMCAAEEASLQSTQSGLPLRKPCAEYSDVESLPILELSAEEASMLSRAVAEKRFQSGADYLATALERL